MKRRGLGILTALAVAVHIGIGPVATATENGAAEPRLEQIRTQILEAHSQWRSHFRQTQFPQPRPVSQFQGRKEVDLHRTLMPHSDQQVRVIVEVEAQPVAAQLSAEGKQLSQVSPADLETARKQILRSVNKTANTVQKRGVSVRNKYTLLLAGFSAEIPFKDVEHLKRVPGVKNVSHSTRYLPENRHGTEQIGATEPWRMETGLDGEGRVIAIVDSGIDYHHEAFGQQSHLDPAQKVIGGWNFADNDANVVPTPRSSPHGTHVAATAAGIGPFAGVAPGAKLLAQKVFSNDPDNPYAWSDDIIAAIEDAITDTSQRTDLPAQRRHPPADVINLSLGSAGGFVNPDQADQRAVQQAIDAGVVVTLSAGNSGFSTAMMGWPPFYRNQDIAAVGSPSVVPDAISVAASHNRVQYQDWVQFRQVAAADNQGDPVDMGSLNDKLVYQLSSSPVSPSKLGDRLLDVVAVADQGCSSENVPDTVDKKVALIQRGACTFETKVNHAQQKGAAAVIIWNQNGDKDGLLPMGGLESALIPAVMTLTSTGSFLQDVLHNDGSVQVNFNGDPVSNEVQSPHADTIADFSSWGTAPDLTPKPDLTAPGADIKSAVAAPDRYEAWNGTSMAAPHVAGAAALLKQANPHWGPAEVKAALQNTAYILMDPDALHRDAPYSVRVQGAGRIQVDLAAATPVLALADSGIAPSTGYLALGQVDPNDTTPFSFTLSNHSDQDVTYQVSGLPVFKPEIGLFGTFASLSNDLWHGAAVDLHEDTVTVPAHGQVQVQGTLDVSRAHLDRNTAPWGHWAETFITLTSDQAPDLSLPLLAFAGEFDQMPVLDPGREDPWCFTCRTGLYDKILSDEEATDYTYPSLGTDLTGLHYDPEWIAISPNGDGTSDAAYPLLELLRGARETTIDITDTQGEPIRRVTHSPWLRNLTIGWHQGPWMWDGTRYDSRLGRSVVVPDGQYQMQIRTLPATGDTWQTYTIPIKVDTEAPSVHITSAAPSHGDTFRLTWEADDFSGVFAYALLLNGEPIQVGSQWWEIFLPGDQYEFNLDLNHLQPGQHEIAVVALDNAFNLGVDFYTFPLPADGAPSGPIHYLKAGEPHTLQIPLRKDTTRATYNLDDAAESEIAIDDNQALVTLSAHLLEGSYSLTVREYSADTEIPSQTHILHVVLDGSDPRIDLQSPSPRDIYGHREVTVFATIHDASPVTVTLNGQSAELRGNSLKQDITLPGDGRHEVTITAVDAIGHTSTLTRTFYVDTTAPEITLDVPDDAFEWTGSQFLLTGQVSDNLSPYRLSINANVIHEEWDLASETNPYPIDFTIPLQDGVNHVLVEAEDYVGNKTTRMLTIIRRPDRITAMTVPTIFSPQVGSAEIQVTLDSRDWLSIRILDEQGRHVASVHEGTEPAGQHTIRWDGRDDDARFVPDGRYTVIAQTKSGSHRAAPIIIDTVPPTRVTLISPPENQTTRTFAIEATAQDAERLHLLVKGPFHAQTVTMEPVDDKFVATVTVPRDGIYQLMVEAHDAAGNATRSKIHPVRVDTTPPTLLSIGWKHIQQKSPTISLSGYATEHLSDVEITVLRTGEDVTEHASVEKTLSGMSWRIRLTVPEDGSYEIRLVGVDVAGNRSSERGQIVRTVLVDNLPPIISVSGLEEGKLTIPSSQQQDYILRFSATDPAGIKSSRIGVTVNGRQHRVKAERDGTYSVRLRKVLKTTNQVNIASEDRLGNSSQDDPFVFTLEVDPNG